MSVREEIEEVFKQNTANARKLEDIHKILDKHESQWVSVEKLAYLNKHHEITETYIGTARLYLKKGKPEVALRELDLCCKKIELIDKVLKHSFTPPESKDNE